MSFKKLISIILFQTIVLLGFTQSPTVGLRHYEDGVTEGYTLFSPGQNKSVYLINNCGEVVNEWLFSERPGATCYLLENGNLLRAGKDSLEIRDWDNNLLWSYAMNDNGYLQHHDIEPLPNGNILCVLTDRYTKAEMVAEGRDSTFFGPNFRLDKIIELEPVGLNDANLVWEWKIKDHLIQDHDATKLNFGVVEDHPELLDINFDNAKDEDWFHTNAIDYNADLDQIIISPRHLSEIYIIDHSTTTAEAASHTGGTFNKGGDILWRWGNPQVYRQTGAQQLFFQHDSRWVDSGFADEGKISVFNNDGDGSGDFSSVHLITPVIANNAYTIQNNMFLPSAFDWSWDGILLGDTLDENKKSGAHLLRNGNVIICETSIGQISEITKAGDHLWSYKNPTGIGPIADQFSPVADNDMFRGEKYEIDYPGFAGKDLSSQGILENENALTATCLTADVDEKVSENHLRIVNPVKDGEIIFNKNIEVNSISVCSLNGQVLYSEKQFAGKTLNIDLESGIYILQIENENRIESHKIVVY